MARVSYYLRPPCPVWQPFSSCHHVGVAWSGWKAGRLTNLHANNEFFLDWDSGEFRENLTIPLAASFKLHETVCLELFPMVRSSKGGDDWTHEFIIGTHLVWKP